MTASGFTVGSTFSGIGGMDLGLHRAGWKVKWQVEIDEYRRRVLARHWPDVPKFGDITTVDPGELEPVDLLCGGFPCQDLSVAGARAGLAGERSGLFFQFARLAGALRPRWLLVENVPGLFSSQAGRDFEVVLSTLDELGYGLAWRVLDSQNFGVPQRRRRVYIVGHLGAPCPPEILLEPESGTGDSQAGQQAGQDVAGTLAAGAHPSGFNGRDAERGSLIPDIAHPLRRRSEVQGSPERSDITLITGTVTGAEAHNGNSRPIPDNYVVANGLRASDGHHGHSSPRGDGADNLVTDTLRVGGRDQGAGDSSDNTPLVAFRKRTRAHTSDSHDESWEEAAHAAPTTGDHRPTTLVGAPPDADGVREATGPTRRVDSDGRRYAGLGDAVTANVAEWIGRRILIWERR